jgi:hypothetical protein
VQIGKFILVLNLIIISPQAAAVALMIKRDTEGHGNFQNYETNSLLAKRTYDDNNALEINVSMRYIFSQDGTREVKKDCNYYHFFSYTGKYDFYWLGKDTRPSGPVISRLQNPAYHFRLNGKLKHVDDRQRDVEQCQSSLNSFSDYYNWLDIGIEHISNGQSLNADENRTFIINHINDHDVMDSVSRVGATVALTMEINKRFIFPVVNKPSELSLKWYAVRVGQEADVYWGTKANTNVDFNDYQLLRGQWALLLGKNKNGLPAQFVTELNIGK